MQTQSRPAGLLRTHTPLIVAVTLLTTVVALGVSLARPTSYVSESRVVVHAEQVRGGTPLPPDMGTEREIALSGEVSRIAGGALGLSAEDASDYVQVEVPVDTNVLEISYAADSGERALLGAQAFTEAYVDYRNSSNGSVVQLITPPSIPTEPTRPNLYLVLAVALLVGLGLGIAIAYAWDRLSPRLRDVADVESQTGLPVLGLIPTLRASPGERIIVGSKQAGPGAEAYGHLTARLLSLLQQHDARSVVITSPTAGVGKTTVTLNLAASMAAAGRDTVVLAADSREVMQIRSGVPRRPGLKELLLKKATLKEAVHDTEIEGLRILPPGGSAQAPPALNIRKLSGVLDELSKSAEVVLVEAPSVIGAVDTAILAEQTDLTLLVVDVRRGRRADASAAVHALSHIGSRLAGCVANDPGRKHQRPGMPQPDRAGFRLSIFGSKGRLKSWSSTNEGNQNATLSSIHPENTKTRPRLRTRSRAAGSDDSNGGSGSTDDRVADVQ